jgi:hypothetical protein
MNVKREMEAVASHIPGMNFKREMEAVASHIPV